MTRNNPILFVVALCCLSPGTYAQSPGGVSTNLTLWMKAESAQPVAGGNLTQWKDEKNTNTFSISGTPTVVKNVINFHSVVRFTGGPKLTGNTNINWSECSAVVSYNGNVNSERGTVIAPTTSGTAVNDASRYFFRSGVEGSTGYVYTGMGVDSIGFEYLNAPPDDEFNLYTASGVGNVFNRNGLNAKVGELYGGFTARATVMNAKPQIGERSTNDGKLLKGDIAEIVLYGQDNAVGRNKVESYLAWKYGLTLGTPASPMNYVSYVGNNYWVGNSTYQNNIFGVGNDAGPNLYQSQSNSMNTGSGDGTGQSGKGNLVLSTLSLPNNQQFLMIGTDLGSLVEQQIASGAGPAVAVTSWRLPRTWKVQNTNSLGAVKLTFSLAGLTLKGGTTYTNYWLMIDNDGNGNFGNGTVTFIQANSITSNQVVFNSVSLPNNVVFTIITKSQSAVALALDWQDFNATPKQGAAMLKWTITNDGNIAHYEIERSLDAVNFIRTGSMSAHQNAGDYTYNEPLGPGNYYYRIKAIDLDGNSTFSPVRSVLITGTGNVFMRLRSNPVVGGRLLLDLWLPEKNTAMIRIVDRQGKSLFQKQFALSQASNLVPIDVSNYPAGLYFIQAQTGQEHHTLPFLK